MSTTAAVQADALLLQLVTAATVCGSFLSFWLYHWFHSLIPLLLLPLHFTHFRPQFNSQPSVHHLTRPDLTPRGYMARYGDQNKPTENALFSNAVPVVAAKKAMQQLWESKEAEGGDLNV